MAVIGDGTTVVLDHIVLATDFTPASETAQVYAQALAKRFASKLTVANVIDLSMAARTEEIAAGLPLEEMRQESSENIDRSVSELCEAGISVTGRMLEGLRPAETALKMVDECHADLLVIGTHGRKGCSRFLLGSFAEAAIHHAKCPVFTIGPRVKPPGGGGINFYTILFATDLRHDTVEKAAIAIAFAEGSCSRVLLCHVVEHPASDTATALAQQLEAEATLRRLIPGAAYDWCDPQSDVEFGDPASQILRVARQTEADLIVLGAHRSATWFTSLKQGVASRVIEDASCPVMTVCTQ